jgi:hypothetical protein
MASDASWRLLPSANDHAHSELWIPDDIEAAIALAVGAVGRRHRRIVVDDVMARVVAERWHNAPAGFTVDDGIVTMTDKDGIPAGVETGKAFSHKLKRGEDPREWAARMTKELRREFKGGKDRVMSGFNGPIPYPKLPKFM